MNKDITKFNRENWCKRKQTQSISAMNSQSSINWVKLLQSLAEMLQKSAEKNSAGNVAEIGREKVGRKMGKNRPENGQKSAEKSWAEKGSEIGREKFGRKRSAAKGRPQKVGREIVANSTGTQL